MKLTSTWLQEWLRRTMLDEQIVDSLAQAGMEIEQVSYSKQIDKNVVVCSVKKVVQHPGADRLKLVTVATNEGEFRVVCGAPNVRRGLKVPFAQIGTVLPDGEKIAKAKLRGEVSEGMLCSERELGLGNDHDGILELPSDAPLGVAVAELFPADTLIEVKTPANRFDVQSVLGLARDAAGMMGYPLADLPQPSWKFEAKPSVLAAHPAAARMALVRLRVTGGSAPSPQWLQARLRAAGMRPINLLVDITNFVMLDVGQPLHAYDADQVMLPFDVRLAKTGEILQTLDGVDRALSPDDLVVTDARGAIGLAGVMGGQATEVRDETREIWLEAAVFDQVRVRRTAQRYGLRTEASARFERGLPVELPMLGLARAVALLEQLAGAQRLGAVAVGAESSPERELTLNIERLASLVSFDISHKEAAKALAALQFKLVHITKQQIVVAVPWWRPDVTRPIDLVEEVVRVIGYDRIPSRLPTWRPQSLAFDRDRARRRQVRDVLFAAGLFEVMTYSFVSHEQVAESGMSHAGHLKLLNPLSVEQAYLRSGMLASHLTVAERNRTYADALAFYEISKVFAKRSAPELPDEPLRLAVSVVQPAGAYRKIKGLLDGLASELGVELEVRAVERVGFAPGRAGEIYLGTTCLGQIGQLHPSLVQSHKIEREYGFIELDLQPLLDAVRPRQFSGLNRYPVIRRDVSVWVPVAVYWADVTAILDGYAVEYVDEYDGSGTPDGLRGLTLRVTISRSDQTPTESEADETVEAVLRRLEHRLHARRRD